MVAVGSFIGIIILVLGITTFGAGIKPVALALIGLPVSAAINYSHDMQEVRAKSMNGMNQDSDSNYEDTARDTAVFYYENPNESYSYATEGYHDTIPFPDSEWYQGTWRYTRITKDGIDVTTLSENDTMQLNSNRFRYDIESLNKHSNGIFSAVELYNRFAFKFMYLAPDEESVEQIRTFKIDYINRDSLCISEGPLVFEYRKK